MPVPTLPVAAVSPGNVLTSTMWNSIVKDGINKLLNTGHRVLTVAQFAALTSPEGTKGTVAPDEVYLEVDSTNGIQWHLAYESGEATYKWRFLGGPPLVSIVDTAESTASATDVDLTTVGPSITLPRGGDYDAVWDANVTNPGNSGAGNASSYLYRNASQLAGLVTIVPASNGSTSYGGRFRRVTASAASDVVKMKYAITNSLSTTFANRALRMTPVRLI